MTLIMGHHRQLTTAREINKACFENINSRAQGVYCTTAQGGYGLRVCRARTVKSVLQVRIVGEGWIVPASVYQV